MAAATPDGSSASTKRLASDLAAKHKAESDAIRQELAATNTLLLGLGKELSASRVETAVRVEGLRAEQNRERRVRMMAIAGLGVGVIYVTDDHVQHCSPGSRTAAVFNASERGVTSKKKLLEIYDHPPGTTSCDVAFPLHSHSADPYPTTGNLVGSAILGLIVLGTVIYHNVRTRKDFRRVEQAAQMETQHAGNTG